MSLLPSDTSREDSTAESYIPFKNFFVLISFIASVDVAVCISASLTLACSQSFFGRTDEESIAIVRHGAEIFAWSAASHGAALVLSLLSQLLFTSPRFGKLLVERPYKRRMRWLVGSVAWLNLALVAGGTALIGEGMKIVDKRVGALLQWILLAIGLPVLVFWIALRWRGQRRRKAERKTANTEEKAAKTSIA